VVFRIEVGNDKLIEDIRRRMAQGHVATTIERIRKIAARSNDAELLQELVTVLADTIESPPKRPRGRPAKSAPYRRTEKRGDAAVTVYDLDAMIPMTDRQMRVAVGRLALHLKVRDSVDKLRSRRPRLGVVGAIREAARIIGVKESEASKAYYRDDSK